MSALALRTYCGAWFARTKGWRRRNGGSGGRRGPENWCSASLSTASPAVRPFKVAIPQADITAMKRRIGATRWADAEPAGDDSQGVRRQTLDPLMRYWATDYDWRKVEARLNALPMFVTQIDGLDIQFIHVRSRHDNALPMILTHGWPGSILEFLKAIDPLTNPTAHGGRG